MLCTTWQYILLTTRFISETMINVSHIVKGNKSSSGSSLVRCRYSKELVPGKLLMGCILQLSTRYANVRSDPGNEIWQTSKLDLWPACTQPC